MKSQGLFPHNTEDIAPFKDLKILVVGMGNSSHLTSYLEKLLRRVPKVEFINCGASEGYVLPQGIHDVSSRFQRSWFGSRYLWWVDRIFFGSGALARIIHTRLTNGISHDVVIAHDLQRAGYATSLALKGLPVQRSGQIHLHGVSLGNDLYWYPGKLSHRRRITRLIQVLASIEIECSREKLVLERFGFKGFVFGARPNTPINFSAISTDDVATRERRLILIKGYGGKWGLGWKAVLASWMVRESLRSFEVLVYSASKPTQALVQILRSLGMNIRTLQNLPREHFLDLLMATHVHIGVSKSDGLATASAEAGLLGAYVIQSRSSCVAEYLGHVGNVRILEKNTLRAIAAELHGTVSLAPSHAFAAGPAAAVAMKSMGAERVYADWEGDFLTLLQGRK